MLVIVSYLDQDRLLRRISHLPSWCTPELNRPWCSYHGRYARIRCWASWSCTSSPYQGCPSVHYRDPSNGVHSRQIYLDLESIGGVIRARFSAQTLTLGFHGDHNRVGIVIHTNGQRIIFAHGLQYLRHAKQTLAVDAFHIERPTWQGWYPSSYFDRIGTIRNPRFAWPMTLRRRVSCPSPEE